jgi:hypothetical protein
MSPFDSFGNFMSAALMLFVAVILLVFFLRRLLWWMDQRGWILYSGDPPTYGSLGNAFQQIQSLGEPLGRSVKSLRRRPLKTTAP